MITYTSLFKAIDVIIQLLFTLAIFSVFLAKYSSKFKGFLKYGKTLNKFEKFHKNDIWLLDEALNIQIPRLWFAHFYLLSLILSSFSFTLVQLAMHGQQFYLVSILKQSQYGKIPIEISRLVIFLIIGHSAKRLSETLLMMKSSSSSKMNISHYLVGLFFYSSLNIQLLVNTNFNDLSPIDQSNKDINIQIFGPLVLFFLASSSQFLHHLHLSKLVKYTVPTFGMFKFLCCAHYFDEILIYFSIFALLKNITMFLALVWVIANLSVSSIETSAYYKKNNNGKIPKWSIIPFLL